MDRSLCDNDGDDDDDDDHNNVATNRPACGGYGLATAFVVAGTGTLLGRRVVNAAVETPSRPRIRS